MIVSDEQETIKTDKKLSKFKQDLAIEEAKQFLAKHDLQV